MNKVREIELENGYEIEVFELSKDSLDVSKEDGYRFMGWINKDGEMMEGFEGSGNFSTPDDVVSYLEEYLVSLKEKKGMVKNRLVQLTDDEGSVLLMNTNLTDEEIQMAVEGEELGLTQEEQDNFDYSDYEDKLSFISERLGKSFERVYYEEVFV